MNTSLFELFKIGIGPSSSHTVGPMRAAMRFASFLHEQDLLSRVARVAVELYGSLALTGIGHGTDRAVLLGLLGEAPDTVDPAAVEGSLAVIRASGMLPLLGQHPIRFEEARDLLFHRDRMYPDVEVPAHPNGLRCTAWNTAGQVLASEVFYSVGGGFIVSSKEFAQRDGVLETEAAVPLPFRSAEQLLRQAVDAGLTIPELMRTNEVALMSKPGVHRPPPLRTEAVVDAASDVEQRVLSLWAVMQRAIERGIATEGTLPGGLNVRRRAPGLARRRAQMDEAGKLHDPLAPLDAVTLTAMAVNEENAAGGRVVTAPTNGAAGVIPAVALYYQQHASPECTAAEQTTGLLRFFFTAAAIGILYK